MASVDAKAPAFVKFLRKVKRFYEGKRVWLFVDNGPTHTSAKAKRYVESHEGIELRFLPPYSPDLNPKEQWWKFLRRKFLANKCFETPHQPTTAISGYTRLTQPQTVQSVCLLEPLRQLA
jgi:transposase